jgi:hypothetical protein
MPLPEELIRAGGATLAFDTNAILGFSPGTRRVVFGAFMKMCDDAHLLRTAARPLWLSIVVPSLVHMEVLHDLRVARARGGPGLRRRARQGRAQGQGGYPRV